MHINGSYLATLSRERVIARLASLAQIGELAHRLATLSIVWLNKGGYPCVDKIPEVDGKDDHVATAQEMILPTLIWYEYQRSLFQASR